jgi:tRNA pseudouridine38-40 synthase
MTDAQAPGPNRDSSLDAFSPTVRLRLDLAYDGGGFAGWARQPGQRTVQQVVEEALARITRQPAVRLIVAGRTDAGVHATGQVAHFDLSVAIWDNLATRLMRSLGGLLPPDVRVRAVTPAADGFDARFSALWRRYEYLIRDDPSTVDPRQRGYVLAWPRPLDDQAMAAAATSLLGLHDFAAYCRYRPEATTIRSLEAIAVRRVRLDPTAERPRGELRCSLRADAFCHSMVRSLIGALIAVGEGRRPVDWPAELLSRTRRSDDVTVAPAHGLTLVEVGYPADDELAGRAELTRALRTPLDDPTD